LDILEKQGLKVPETYADLLALAKKGLVAFAGIPVDVLMSFYMYCCSLGEAPFQSEEKVISAETGKKALQMFRELAQLIDPANFNRNPIQVYEAMVNSDEIAYCPFAYGYSNYSRIGYSQNLLYFYDLVKLNDQPMISSLGGTGLAVSSFSQHIPEAIKYAEFTGSSQVQQNIFADNGGQPGHLQAWKSDRINQLTHDYFKNTLPALERAFLRPRYSGHMYFQDHAGDVVRDYLMKGGNEELVLSAMNALYVKSLNLETK
jgi:multiple sugar transport system substrate-binding protein